jgi:hypothetical protein
VRNFLKDEAPTLLCAPRNCGRLRDPGSAEHPVILKSEMRIRPDGRRRGLDQFDSAELAPFLDEESDLHHALRSSGDALRWQAQQRGRVVMRDVESMTQLGLLLSRGVLGVAIAEHML